MWPSWRLLDCTVAFLHAILNNKTTDWRHGTKFKYKCGCFVLPTFVLRELTDTNYWACDSGMTLSSFLSIDQFVNPSASPQRTLTSPHITAVRHVPQAQLRTARHDGRSCNQRVKKFPSPALQMHCRDHMRPTTDLTFSHLSSVNSIWSVQIVSLYDSYNSVLQPTIIPLP